MEAIENLVTRRSIRKFRSDMVPKEVIEKIIEAGTYAPTGMNRQSPIIIAVTNKELRDRLSAQNAKIMGADIDPFYNAPCVICVLADKQRSTAVEDGSLAIGNMCLAAHSLGLASCWIHRCRQVFESAEGKALLDKWGVSGEYVGVGFCILGHSDTKKEPAARKENRVFYID